MAFRFSNSNFNALERDKRNFYLPPSKVDLEGYVRFRLIQIMSADHFFINGHNVGVTTTEGHSFLPHQRLLPHPLLLLLGLPFPYPTKAQPLQLMGSR
ncbi:hypothetical protein RND71_003023 [Anisodus tanguticus]|uniref:Uncharacterized protein n=1 Tax=Anisodus tanguticus TaxID=243964 RepID=A0AAE1SX54_9SOLA|nr:hypothetical protein RND71_003023 [Anisodus tanguticus]